MSSTSAEILTGWKQPPPPPPAPVSNYCFLGLKKILGSSGSLITEYEAFLECSNFSYNIYLHFLIAITTEQTMWCFSSTQINHHHNYVMESIVQFPVQGEVLLTSTRWPGYHTGLARMKEQWKMFYFIKKKLQDRFTKCIFGAMKLLKINCSCHLSLKKNFSKEAHAFVFLKIIMAN